MGVYICKKSNTHPVITLKAEYFLGDVRMTTCVASARNSNKEVKCMLSMREDFVRMLGDLEYLLDWSYDFRE